MKSIWEESIRDIKMPSFSELGDDIKTDVLIIGGGMAGILCGYMLKKSQIDCVILEAGNICSGTTKNTTAKLTFQHGLIYNDIINKYGIEKARLYLKAQKEALESFYDLSKKIPCDFSECDAFVYSKYDREKIEKEVEAYKKLGVDASFYEEIPLPFSISGAVKVEKQAQFNPLKFISGIADGLVIYENTKVREIKNNCAITDKAKIRADKIIVATHFPFIDKHGGYFLKMYQHRSYVLALKNAPIYSAMYVDEDKKGMSFREYKGHLILGGGGHRTGKQGGGWNELSEFSKKYYPDAEEVLRWAAQDCITLDAIPYIGQYSRLTPSLYVTTGFNKWGMTSSMASATILNDLIQEKENEYASLFCPSRSILHPQLLCNTFESVTGLLNPITPRCTHLGCALKYNKHEHSWDCSCHGSRFSEKGKVINNPSNKDLKMKKI